ncbi:MAG: DNA gyrase subunit A [Syntrophomonadaceae bacterium]|nr:DNA gyrase subunit A [Syntrophomonadaceae bacterium]
MNLFDNVVPVSMAAEMESSFMDYAMSVIVSRALPDVRDGLKPVHRRILYALHDLGIGWDKPYRKSAYLVGEVLGKYHPHGDSSVYDAAVRMVQDFAMRCPLIDGQGNWGSVDGDSAAALRYTELRMARIAHEMLADIDKAPVNFVDNYDGTRQEPEVLPSRIPNLLLNGSTGIAVGMATNIPPHNLNEITNGLVYLIDNPQADVHDLLKYIKGPDFPTGGLIMGNEGIVKAYETGRGSIKMRAKTEIESLKGGREAIIIKELPYQVNKARLVEKIAELAKEKTSIEGISDLRDESDREGIRVVVELKKDANTQLILNQLFKHTQMEDTFGVIMLALVNGKPRELNLKEMLSLYLDHRKDVISRCTRYDLDKAEKRLHIVEGLKIAHDNLDEVLNLIRNSKDPNQARANLRLRFALSDIQAQAILDMRLQKLTGLERESLEDELINLLADINRYKEILGDESKIMAIIKTDLKDVKNRFGDPRRTELHSKVAELPAEDIIPDEDVVLTLTRAGYVRKQTVSAQSAQRSGGTAGMGLVGKQDGLVLDIIKTRTLNWLLCLTNQGRAFKTRVHKIKETGIQGRGVHLANIINMAPGEKVISMTPLEEFADDRFLLMVTRKGLVKKTRLAEYDTNRHEGIIAITLDENDEVIDSRLTDGSDQIILAANDGVLIRFPESDVRPTGRVSKGVRGITLTHNSVIGMTLAGEGSEVLVISVNGFAKRTPMEEYPDQARGGKGVKTMNTTVKTGDLAIVIMVNEEDEFVLLTSSGRILSQESMAIPVQGRATQGEIIKKLNEKESIAAISRIMNQPAAPQD